MADRLTFHPLAADDLFRLYSYIARQSGTERAGRYLERIERRIRALETFPQSGTLREDLAPGVRTIGMERRVLIVYRERKTKVEVLRVMYGGRDFSGDDLPP